MFQPNVPDFTRRDRYLDLVLRMLNELNELIDRAFAAVDRFVADHETVDVAVLAGELDGGAHLPRVASLVLVDPRAHGDLEVEAVRDRRNELDTAGGRIGADCSCVRGNSL